MGCGGWSRAMRGDGQCAARMALTVSVLPAFDGGMTGVADIRECEQCGTSFVPRREHARFCCAGCRGVWNREHIGDLAAEESALVWSLTAMGDTSERLCRVRAWDRARALAVIGEAVWWITIVDATLVRHHLQAYDAAMASQAPAERELVEGTLAGLRLSGIGSAAKPILLSSPGPAGPAWGLVMGVSPAGCGSRCRNRRWDHFHHAGRRGR
jgi:hypothetical protein